MNVFFTQINGDENCINLCSVYIIKSKEISNKISTTKCVADKESAKDLMRHIIWCICIWFFVSFLNPMYEGEYFYE